MIGKICNKCGEDKVVEDFFFRNKAKNYRSSYCKKCFQVINNAYKATRKEEIKVIKKREYRKNKEKYLNRNLLDKYGITRLDFLRMRADQNECCYICGIHYTKRPKGLLVDHNHTTGKVRKLLCNQCNSILGYSYENIEVLENAIKYLKEHE